MHDTLLLAAALGYLGAVFLLYLSVLKRSPGQRKASVALACTGALLHAAAQYSHWMPITGQELNVLNVLSLCALVAVALLVLSLTMKQPLYDAGLVVLPIAVLVLVSEWAVDWPGNLVSEDSLGLTVHILASVMAFGVLSIAAVYAGFVTLIDFFLRRRRLNRLMRSLPGLVALEGLLFQLIAVGFAVLTVALGTGLVYVDDLFEQHLAHKTILSCLAWLVFGVLLWGRQARGCRGRVAVRMTIAGVLILLLSYFGSKLVLEVFLDSSWQA